MSRILAVAGLTLAWPVLQIGVFWLRFSHLPPNGLIEGLVFIPMGFLSAIVAVWLWSRAETARRRRNVVAGYLWSSPVAFLGSLLGGLVLPGFLGPLVFGALPLIAGSFIGYRHLEAGPLSESE